MFDRTATFLEDAADHIGSDGLQLCGWLARSRGNEQYNANEVTIALQVSLSVHVLIWPYNIRVKTKRI